MSDISLFVTLDMALNHHVMVDAVPLMKCKFEPVPDTFTDQF